MTLPSGNIVAYTHVQGKPTSITLNGAPLLTNITHDPDGEISGWTWPNGQRHVRAYGQDGELQRIESAIATTYSHDPAGQITGLHHWSQTNPPQNDLVRQYAYDPAGRITGATSTETPPTGNPLTDTLIYGYDLNGNRQQLDWNGIQTNHAYSGNRITQSTGAATQTPTWDAAGRMTGDGTTTYAYNALGRLVTVKQGTTTVASYQYNALGQRVKKTGQGGNVRFIYDEAGHLIGEYSSTGKLVQEIVWLEDLPIASLRPKTSGTGVNIYTIHPDHLGTPRQITNSQNKILWRWDTRDAFGSERPNEDADGDGKRFSFNLRFPGQYFDRETGRHDNWWRVYDPLNGRYTTSDPIGLDGGLNRFAYVGGNPVSSIDPNGTLTMLGGVAVAGGLLGAYAAWSKYADLQQCKIDCKKQCESIPCSRDDPDAAGNNLPRCLATCSPLCLAKFMGSSKKGPTGPQPPKKTPPYFDPRPQLDPLNP
jgi:RHS repeat-associated protein